jgi:PAS domain S-box-containing protein
MDLLHELQVHQVELEMQNEELRRTQVQLDTAQADYFDLYNLAPVGYCTLSEQGLILQANLTAATLLGTTRDALVLQPISRFILKEDQDIYYLFRKRLVESDESLSCELRMVKNDGTQLWVRLAATAASDASGSRQLVGGAPVLRIVLSDITEYQAMVTELKESEEHYRCLAEDMPLFIATFLPDGTLTYVNEAMTTLVAMTKEELAGINFFEFLTAEDRQMLKAKFALLTPEQPLETHEQRYLGLGEMDAYLQWTNRAFFDDAGNVTHFQSVGKDISEKKRIEARLIASEKRYLALFRDASEPIAIADANGIIEEVNSRFAALLGYAVDELRGMSLERIHLADDLPRIRQHFDEIFSIGHNNPLEIKIVRKDGMQVEVEIRTTQIEIGGVKVAQGIFTDLTERKRQEQQRIAEETAHRNTLVREVHHRIKNNLQSVAGLLQRELGRFVELDPRLETAIGQVNAIAVVHGLQSADANETIRLCDSIRNICTMASNLTQRKVLFQIENEDTTFRPVAIESNEAVSVALVINELILNALKHSPEDRPAPTVSLSADGTSALLVIRNTLSGTNVPEFDIETGKGLGTGLRLVRSLLPEEGAQLAYELDRRNGMLTILRMTAPVVVLTPLIATDRS